MKVTLEIDSVKGVTIMHDGVCTFRCDLTSLDEILHIFRHEVYHAYYMKQARWNAAVDAVIKDFFA